MKSLQEVSPVQQPPTPPNDNELFPPQYAYYYPDEHPSLFVSFLGQGHQGAAVLVRSLVDGNLYVRKRKGESSSHLPADNETSNAIPHPHIPKLISQTKLDHTHPISKPLQRRPREQVYTFAPSNQQSRPTADLWSFANGQDLYHLVSSFYNLKPFTPVPPVIVFTLMYQLLAATIHIHNNNIAHGDIIPDNVFVHWPPIPSTPPTTAASYLPHFLLGDFGVSFTLPPPPELKRNGIHDTASAVYGDIASIAAVTAFAMNGHFSQDYPSISDKVREWYSTNSEEGKWLVTCFDNLAKLTRILKQFNVCREADGDMFARIAGSLVQDIETGGRMCLPSMEVVEEGEGGGWQDPFAKVRPRVKEEDRRVMMAWDRETLLAREHRPPGPWYVAQVDGLTGRLLGVEFGVKYCEFESKVTGKEEIGFKRFKEVEAEEVREMRELVCG